MKKVIGLVGEKGGGKGSFFAALKELAPDKKIERVSSSELLFKTLNTWAIPTERANLINLVSAMNEGFGEGTVTNALYEQAKNSAADIIVIDSIRLQTDYDMLRKFPDGILLYITTDPKIRYERSKARGEKAGESNMTFEKFMSEESAHTEKLIPEFGKKADFTINNNGTLDEFMDQVKEFIEKTLL